MRNQRCRYKLTRKGRLAVVYGAVNEIQEGLVGATMTQIARYMSMKPSTYVMNCLKELEACGVVYHAVEESRNGVLVREWFIVRPEHIGVENPDE